MKFLPLNLIPTASSDCLKNLYKYVYANLIKHHIPIFVQYSASYLARPKDAFYYFSFICYSTPIPRVLNAHFGSWKNLRYAKCPFVETDS